MNSGDAASSGDDGADPAASALEVRGVGCDGGLLRALVALDSFLCVCVCVCVCVRMAAYICANENVLVVNIVLGVHL